MGNTLIAVAGAFIAIVGILFLLGLGANSKRPVSSRRRRLIGIGFVLLGATFLLQGLASGSTILMALSIVLALGAIIAFVWSIVIARQEKRAHPTAQ